LPKKKIDTVGVLGSGRIARRAVEAVACVRQFRRLKVYSPTAENRQSYVKEMSELLKIEVESHDDPRAVVQGSKIVITATTAYKPVYDGAWLEPGTLVITMAPGEIDRATVERSTIFATWKDQTFHDQPAREPFKTLAAEGKLATVEARSHELHDAVTGKVTGRNSADEIITCLVPASSLWDPAFARWAYDRDREKGLGTEIKF
jgi:alanine dehydrogenase